MPPVASRPVHDHPRLHRPRSRSLASPPTLTTNVHHLWPQVTYPANSKRDPSTSLAASCAALEGAVINGDCQVGLGWAGTAGT